MFSKNKKKVSDKKVEEVVEDKKEEVAELNESEKLEKQSAESTDAKALADKYLDGWKRCQADFENYKKRQAGSTMEMLKYANESLLLEIMPVLDNFHASTDHIPEDQKGNAWVIGIMHIQKQLEQILKDNGVTEIETKVGDNFDPVKHEAVADEKENKEEIKNKIAKVIQRGYMMNDKVIRPARVVVE
jgi:molecular chaperone GrpE